MEKTNEQRSSVNQSIFNEIKDKIKLRGGSFKKEDFESSLIKYFDKKYITKIVDEYTPDSFYLKAALEDQDFKRHMISQFKKKKEQNTKIITKRSVNVSKSEPEQE